MFPVCTPITSTFNWEPMTERRKQSNEPMTELLSTLPVSVCVSRFLLLSQAGLSSHFTCFSLRERGRDWCPQRPLGEAPGKTETTRRFFYEINQRFG
ncbi:hypothetical protein ILYODFUR_008613 [Ilyodon furcidens]|uniref:Uncharacterized protein n=1 Tax=Ilyodon furcidens TaxID=33524 RepID=A0ABV0TWT3_9TELE